MALKDRIKNKKTLNVKEENLKETTDEICEFNISAKKIVKAVNEIDNLSDLGNIVQEFTKFLGTLSTENATITLRGNFDLGQKTLLSCVLSNFIDEENQKEAKEENEQDETITKAKPRLIRKRKSIRKKLAEIELANEDTDEI